MISIDSCKNLDKISSNIIKDENSFSICNELFSFCQMNSKKNPYISLSKMIPSFEPRSIISNNLKFLYSFDMVMF